MGGTLHVEEILSVSFSFLSDWRKGHGYLIGGQTTLVQLIEHQTTQELWIKPGCGPWEGRPRRINGSSSADYSGNCIQDGLLKAATKGQGGQLVDDSNRQQSSRLQME